MELIDVNEKVGFAPEFMPRILRMASGYKVPLICLEPGQEIKPHQSGTGVFYFISGRGVMTVEGKEMEVGPGNMAFVEKGETRGIRATERLTAFAVHIG
ncbi:MAG TPA: cupin domain-containing protein [Thermodesulfobacteriota bacterium]|nr:cupin domain-containing protein [Thermodesulfobacteriota bacterium]